MEAELELNHIVVNLCWNWIWNLTPVSEIGIGIEGAEIAPSLMAMHAPKSGFHSCSQ